jgi:hypothetical protein
VRHSSLTDRDLIGGSDFYGNGQLRNRRHRIILRWS